MVVRCLGKSKLITRELSLLIARKNLLLLLSMKIKINRLILERIKMKLNKYSINVIKLSGKKLLILARAMFSSIS